MNINKFLLLLLLALLVGCSEFERNYDQIDDDMVRVIDFSFENPELAPGDTAIMYAIFAGKEVKLEDITWSVSWDITSNQYVEGVAFNEQPLEGFIIEPVTDSELATAENNQIFKITFVVPTDVVRKSSAVAEDWAGQLNDMYGLNISAAELGLPNSKSGMIDMLESFAADHSLIEKNGFNGPMIELSCQILTTTFHLNADVKGSNRKVLKHSVRYNKKFEGVKGVFINKRPQVETITMYRYKGAEIKRKDIHNKTPDSSFIMTGDTTTMKFDTDNYTYMIKFELPAKDTTLSLERAFEYISSDTVLLDTCLHIEKYEGYSFVQRDNELVTFEMYNENLDSTAQDPKPELFIKVTPKDNKIGAVTTWFKLSDSRTGVKGRPRGSITREMTFNVLE